MPDLPDPRALATDLLALGVAARVEAHDRLALLAVAAVDADRLADDALRRHVVALVAARGFTHVALDLAGDGDGERGAPGGR